jgi:hypothetical protein
MKTPTPKRVMPKPLYVKMGGKKNLLITHNHG